MITIIFRKPKKIFRKPDLSEGPTPIDHTLEGELVTVNRDEERMFYQMAN